MSNLKLLKSDLQKLSTVEKAKNCSRFFKTGKGQYGEGDVFLGVTLPEQRKVIKPYLDLPLEDVSDLLQSQEHEFRMCALLILIDQFKKASSAKQEEIFKLYLQNTNWINNWDLVDASAEFIVGSWLEKRIDKMKVLTALAKSENLWERRIAMLATFCYIKNGHATDALEVAKILLNDEEDLIQKAVGWMLREIGKRCSIEDEEKFLKEHYRIMPRTMLRYAVEHFSETKRQFYLKANF